MFYNLPVFNPLVGAFPFAYSTFTAIFNSFLLAGCVILAELLIFQLRKIDRTGWFKLHISAVSYLSISNH